MTPPAILVSMFCAVMVADQAIGQPIEGFHIVEGLVSAGHGLQLTPHMRLRTADRFRQLSQVRAGLILTKAIGPRLDVLAAGYYEPTVKQPRFPASYRIQLGGQAHIPIANGFTAQPRVLWERLNRTTGLAYRRVRMGGRITWTGAHLSPYLYNDTFLTTAGPAGVFHSARTGAGIGWTAGAQVRLEFEYFYDVRRAFWGGDRQVITTRIQFR